VRAGSSAQEAYVLPVPRRLAKCAPATARAQAEIDEIKAELAMLKSSVKAHSVA